MRKVDEKDETDENEGTGTDEGYVVAPEDEEAIGNEEGEGDKEDP